MAKKLPGQTPTRPTISTDDVALEGPALKLWEDTTNRWELDPVSLRILRSACESLMVSNRCQQLIDRDGLVVDIGGKMTKHPAALIGRDARTAFTLALQKLKLDLA